MQKLYSRLLLRLSHSVPATCRMLAWPLWAAVCALPLAAQQTPPEAIAHTSAKEVQVAGAVDLRGGELQLGNGSTITAADQPVKITLARGGQLLLCSTTSLHLSRDRSIPDPANTALMMALDRGAMEAHYTVGKYSDVLLTPDLRILISGPGQADLSVRVNAQGDTCVDNHGAGAPYVTVSSQLAGGLYRVMPNQRVTFEHGSLSEMVDNEPEPCGCPVTPPLEMAAGTKNPRPGQPMGGPSSTPADTAFPLKESEGLAAPPAPPSTPVVPAGQVHAQVTVPLIYNGAAPAPAPPAATPPVTLPTPAADTAAPSVATPQKRRSHGFFHSIGRFFARILGP